MMRAPCLLFLLLLLHFTASTSTLSTAGENHIDFARDIQPILSDNCYACHGPDEATREGGLRLDTREGALQAIAPGELDRSELITRITSPHADEVMPPAGKKSALTPEQIDLLSRWIQQGAAWGVHWAFTAPQRPLTPRDTTSVIDHFITTQLPPHGLHPAAPATPEELVRRLSLDLTGLPPSLELIDHFLTDGSDEAYSNLVEQLLNSPHYGERWARWWMDAARYADSNGYEKDSPRFAWPYRDWLIDAFNRNMAYDQFIIRQIGGDLLASASLADHTATGFLRNSMVNEEGAIKAEQFRIEGLFDRVDAIGKSVLGLTLQCAQCHTHKYDPILHEDYYGIFAYLNNAHEATIAYHDQAGLAAIRQLQRDLASERAAYQTKHPEYEAHLAAWITEAKAALASEPEWIVVTPEHQGDGGQKFYPQPDGSILTMGYSQARSNEFFLADIKMPQVASLRLELLQDPYLTYDGPGRSLDGSAAISELKFSAGRFPDERKAIEFHPALSDLDLPSRATNDKKYPQKDGQPSGRTEGPAAYINDGDIKTAWATETDWMSTNQARVVYLNLKQPLTSEHLDGTIHLRFDIQCQHGGWNSNDNHHRNVGRFRFSLAAQPYRGHRPLSPEVRNILTKDTSTWTAEEHNRVFDTWVDHHEPTAALSAKLAHLRSQHPAPTPQLTLRERDGIRRPTHLFERGEQTHPRQVITPRVPAFLHPLPEGSDHDSRLTFARWLVDHRSPTTARSLVNRLWAELFGTGIVESVEDLGHQAPPASHQELLDWLAVELMESGWDIKHLLRTIVMSETYQQSSRLSPRHLELDPQNRLLARGPRFRPPAEMIRDIQLSVSGLLDTTLGGESVRPPLPAFLLMPPVSYGEKEWHEDQAPSRRYRRALYTFRFRTATPPFLSAFDAPSGEVSCVARPKSTTPLQALALLNETLSVEAAAALAKTLTQSKEPLPKRLSTAFRRCTGRSPQDRELAMLLNLHDSETAAGSDPFLSIARVLLNLDETITKS